MNLYYINVNINRIIPLKVDCCKVELFGILEPGGIYETVTIQ